MDFSEKEIRDVLRKQIPIIQDCVLNAVRHYQEKLGGEAGIISKTTIANYIRDFMIEFARQQFSGNKNIIIKKRRGIVVFAFKIKSYPTILLKFKKFNKYNIVSIPNTLSAMAYATQGDLFPDYQQTVNLFAGYKWNDTATQIDCLISYPNGDKSRAWVAYVSNNADVAPVIEIPEEERPAKPRVKIINIKKENEKNG